MLLTHVEMTHGTCRKKDKEEIVMAHISGYLMGIGCGLIVLGLVLMAKKKKGKGFDFDERQELERGRGFKYGFFTLLLYNLLCGDVILTWCAPFVGHFIGVCLGLAVFGVYCIWKEAYASLSQTPIAVYTVLGFSAASQILIGLTSLEQDRLIEDGKLTVRSANLFLGAVCALFWITYFLRNRINRDAAEERE